MADYVWTGATSTAANTTTNWLPNGTPGAGDNLIFDGRAQRSLESSLTSLTGTFTSVRVKSSFTYNIGVVSSGTLTRFAIDCTNCIIGEPDGDGTIGAGSSLLAFNFGTVTNTTRVLNAASVGTSGFAPVMLLGTNASNVVIVESGWVGYGTDRLNEASTVVRADVVGDSANLELGGGLTLTTINQTAGRVTFRSNLTTFDQQGGTATSEGSATITTLNCGGTFNSNSSGTITTATVWNGGELNLSGNTVARTITTTILRGTGRIILPSSDWNVVTFTNGVDVTDGARTEQVIGGTAINVAFAAP